MNETTSDGMSSIGEKSRISNEDIDENALKEAELSDDTIDSPMSDELQIDCDQVSKTDPVGPRRIDLYCEFIWWIGIFASH